MFHTSYSLLWIQMLADYYAHSGDLGLVREVLPAVRLVLALFHTYVGSSGLVTEAPNYMFLDWCQVDGYEYHHPPCVIGQGYLSAFYIQALRDSARLFELAGEIAEAEILAGRAKEMTAAFVRELWVPEKGLFCDGIPFRSQVEPNQWLPEDKDCIYFSKHTNALAVAYEIAPPELAQTIMQRIMQDDALPRVQPYFMHFVFDALQQAGLFEQYGFQEIRKWKALLDEHPSSLKEGWNFGDYSHAWGASPVYQFYTQVLGVTPAAPGFRQVRIQPHLGDLTWAEGTIPTPHGPIRCRWERQAGRIVGTLSIPPAVTAHVALPQPEMGSSLSLNGTLVWENQQRINTPWQTRIHRSLIEITLM
jgi:alpha-L-rhamnosidase